MGFVIIGVCSYVGANVALHLCEKYRVHSIWSMVWMIGAMLMPFIVGGFIM